MYVPTRSWVKLGSKTAALQSEVEKVVDRFIEKCDEMQQLYDKETEHGTNGAQQTAWDRKIKRWLETPEGGPGP